MNNQIEQEVRERLFRKAKINHWGKMVYCPNYKEGEPEDESKCQECIWECIYFVSLKKEDFSVDESPRRGVWTSFKRRIVAWRPFWGSRRMAEAGKNR